MAAISSFLNPLPDLLVQLLLADQAHAIPKFESVSDALSATYLLPTPTSFSRDRIDGSLVTDHTVVVLGVLPTPDNPHIVLVTSPWSGVIAA